MEYNKQYRYLDFLENIYKTYSNTKREVTVELTDYLIDIKTMQQKKNRNLY